VADGVLFGNPGQLWIQAAAVGATLLYSGAVTFVLLKLVGVLVPMRADATDEGLGLDVKLHGVDAFSEGV
jgi:Amt family ammonium transporter